MRSPKHNAMNQQTDPFHRELELLLAEPCPVPPGLRAHIRASLPMQDGLQQFMRWLAPGPWGKGIWRPAAAAAAPLALGFLLGLGLEARQQREFHDDVLTYAFVQSHFETEAYGDANVE